MSKNEKNDNPSIKIKEYNLQMNIIKKNEKMKLVLEIKDTNNKKYSYSNSFSLNDLISLNKYFLNYENDYSKAFELLIGNNSKIDKSKISFLNDNKKLILELLFQTNNKNDEKISLPLFQVNTISNPHFSSIINNLKTSLEKFNSSINELKQSINDDKINNEKKIKELENNLNENFMIRAKKNDNLDYKAEFEKISKKLMELEEKLNLNEKNIENNDNNKYSEVSIYKRKENINNLPSKNIKYEKNLMLGNNMENIINDKINEILDDKIQMFEEKIKILNGKIINLEVKNKSKNDESFIIDNHINYSVINERIKNELDIMNNNINNKFINFAKMLNLDIQDLEEQIFNLDQSMNALSPGTKIKGKLKTNDSNQQQNNSNGNITKEEIHDINVILNKLNDKENTDYKDLNNKLSTLKNDLIKIIEINNNLIVNKMNLLNNKGNKLEKNNQIMAEKLLVNDKKIRTIDCKIKQMDEASNSALNKSFVLPKSKHTNISINPNDDNNIINMSFTQHNNLKIPGSEKLLDLDSKIIPDEDKSDSFFLFSKIKEDFNYNMSIRYKLVYRASRDGDESKNFHQKCDLIGPNIVLVKTKKGYTFGGLTTKSWKHLFKDVKKDDPEYGTEIKDEKAFGFSFDEKKIYKNNKIDNPIIFCNYNYGPYFKNYFKIFDKCFQNGGICEKKDDSNFDNIEKDFEFNGGEDKFIVEEIEVFQIGFK